MITDKDIKISQLEWIIAVLILKYQESDNEATIILPAHSLGIYAGFRVDVTITEGDNQSSIVYVKVQR